MPGPAKPAAFVRPLFSYSLWIAIPILTTLTQSCIKMLALRLRGLDFGPAWLLAALHTPWILVILASEALGFILWMRVLSHTLLSRAIPITSMAYGLIILTSWTVFGEPVLPLQLLGSLLILSGICCISAADK